jgi:tripartite-type tricarboxylate transporter receptor subunit TctC
MKKILLSIILFTISMFAFANNFEPTKRQIEIVVPYPPGGATDVLGRLVGEIFAEQGWKTIVVNKPGADAVIGANYASKGKPDGHTLFVGATGALDANIAFKAEGMEYTEKSFTPVVPLANISYVLAVPSNSPLNTYEEFKSYVRANPDQFKLAFWNANTANIFYDWAKKEGLPKPTIVLYKGSGPQMIDLVGGHIQFGWDTWLAMAPQLEDNKVKVLAALDSNGASVIKKIKPNTNIVSIAKTHPDLDIGVWYGLWAPAGTPKSVTDQMNRIINTAFNDPKYKEKVEALNIRSYGGKSEDLIKMQQRNLVILKRIAQELNK